MKIDRRSFLALTAGGTVGTALTPLPWKLTDDISIWSQNWPWTPVPPGGEATHVNSTCTLCPAACGITVRKIDQRAVKIEGMAGHPVNDGGICILGVSGLQLLYGPSRVKTPLKRVGDRGAGHWQPISWDQAVAEVAQKLGELREKGEGHTVAAICGSDRGTLPQLFSRLLTVYGSPNFFTLPTIHDTYAMTLGLMQGGNPQAGFDVENTDYLLSFGSGILEGWGAPVRMFRANSRWRSGYGKVVQVEARLSTTAAKADRWMPVNPGSEAALAMGLAHVILREKLYQRDFIKHHTEGFDEWQKGVLAGYAPDAVAAVSGVPAAEIEALAREFARARKPLAICGRGQGNTPGSLAESMAVHALNALVGNLQRPGGVWAMPEIEYIDWAEAEMDALAVAGLQQDRLDGAGSDGFPYAKYLPNRLVEAVNSGQGYPLQALLVSGANPCYSLADAAAVQKAIAAVPFVVSFSSFMDETAVNADLILPNHTNLERYEDVPTPLGLTRPIIGLSRPVVAPQFNTRHTGDVVIQIARAIGGTVGSAFPWPTYEACLQMTLAGAWGPLNRDGFWEVPGFQPADWAHAFETASGKFEFTNAAITSLALSEPIVLPGDEKAFPLLLMPFDSMRLTNGWIGNPPFMTKAVDDTVLKGDDVLVELNPQTASSLGLSQGQAAELQTPVGAARVRVNLFEGVRPGVVAMPTGLGHTAFDEFIAGKGVNYNMLAGPVADPASGLDAAWGIRAKLTKA
ncbi:MAG: molybdopterin-dependent oxidoreductase [Desulfobacteraceae bacterium]|nr:molybdopterin-dependent oxidoreductase [Desulfobacteraceae bacterium]